MPPHQRADDGFPAPSMQPISVDFIENRYAGFRNTEGELSCKFDHSLQQFVTPPFAASGVALEDYEAELRDSKLRVVATTQSFETALSSLKRKKAKDKKIASFDLDSFHDWKEAMTEHAAVRERMAELLREVPDVVNQCEQYQTLYPGQNTIQLCINDIYHNLLVALEAIVEWYKQSAWSKWATLRPRSSVWSLNRVLIVLEHATDSVLRNNNYGKTIDQCLQNIRQSKSRFTEETQVYLAYYQQATFQGTRKLNAQSHEINSNVLSLGGRVAQAEINLQHVVNAGINGLMGHLDDTIKNADWQGNVEKLARNWMAQQLNAENDKRRIMELEEQVAKTSITPKRLMEELHLKPKKHTHVHEASVVLKDGLNSSTKFQERAGWVGSNSRFQAWLGGKNKSQMLCVQDRGDSDRTSPLSFLISLLHERLVTAPRTLVLPFFCGRSKTDDGPAIMPRALVVQLLDVCKTYGYTGEKGQPILSFLGHEERMQLNEQDCVAYTKVLTQLLRELRKKYDAIFILIDGVDFYDSDFEEEIDDFVKSMKKLIKSLNKPDDEALGGVVRVLLTTATWSSRFDSPAKPLVVIDVPEYIEGSMDGFERFT
ncbi:hypothetical protein J4E93_009210 [Alternaria ventricosa]|uniref:uncharacterized protein n=1 Tax=Alternaria ventricosa TaxID=1187951 RepID=UPI0020C1D118|nr:uncharacterized protein J4E93_009210 [Alternaria ventricosa]KAI4639382.1 hypothetical protein J4E93_009210 [Alternaria ventricosa]